jgi:hypothetical protein
LTHLLSLILADTEITDDGLVHLSGMASLEVLHLNSTSITDAGLEHLKELTNLQALALGRTQVSNNGIRGLKQALPKVQIHLRTSWNA